MEYEIERKWLINPDLPPDNDWPVPFEDSWIQQTGLLHPDHSEGVVERVRRRHHPGGVLTLTHTVKRPTGHVAVREEDERVIDSDEYERLLTRRRDDQIVIEKRRRKFEWEGWTWELDTFQAPAGIVLLELELPSLDIPVNTPPWLSVVEEVTGEPRWTNTWLAMIEGEPDAG